MNVFVTGAGGFIGQNFLMGADSNNRLFGLIHNSDSIANTECIYYKTDICNFREVEHLFSEVKIDVVVHLAAITEHDNITNRRKETLDLNLKGTMNLVECFNKYCRGGLFVYASSGKVYGKTNQMPITETAYTNPTNILGKTKRITEMAIDYLAVPENKYLICRIFNVYGEKQKRTFLLPTIVDQLGNDCIKLGNLKDYRDYIYINDLVSAMWKCIENREKFSKIEYVNIGNGMPVCVKDILDELERILERKFNVLSEENRKRSDETQVEFASIENLLKLTGWKPKYNLHEGLVSTLKGEGVLK